ncbi:MAG: hypothetical protein HQ509_11830 [Candidatus Marinimicrobia bacterium]|nr:hypothetical protein [Candidatus Neomarinimicrobiota bacterium]
MTQATSKGYDTHEINIRYVAGIAVASLLFLIVTLTVTYGYYVKEAELAIHNIVNAPQSEVLVVQQQANAKTLNSYAVIDGNAGIYQVPIARAIELIATDTDVRN